MSVKKKNNAKVAQRESAPEERTKRGAPSEASMKDKVEGSTPSLGTHKVADPKTYSPIVKLMDDGVQKEIDGETKAWNERTAMDRFPLSASQGGKCALALARNLSHYLGVADYPRKPDSISPRVQRIFARGHLLESALIKDLEKFTHLKPVDQQRRVRLLTLGGGKRVVEGNIDAVLQDEENGVRILTDFKSKGAFHSAAFQDTISQFFQELKQTGLVEEIHANCFLITDAMALFNTISLDEFFVDYLIQLNAYAFSVDAETLEPLNIDFVSLYYENKNTCANYEVRWKPQKELYDFLVKKFEYIYDNVRAVAAANPQNSPMLFDQQLERLVPKEYSLGSARCKLCDYNELCWGKYDPTLKPSGNVVIELPDTLRSYFVEAIEEEAKTSRAKEEILNYMVKQDATHITVNGMCFERKFYKSPRPHYELKQVQKPLRSDR